MADAAELHKNLNVRTFYGHKSERAKYVPVLPPENIVSYVGSFSDEEIEEDCNHLDPDFEPEDVTPKLPTEQFLADDDMNGWDSDDNVPLASSSGLPKKR
ncbi:hypothetical protein HHI36_017811 [Cryptolaemus montrouzieri]|uniref:Uncharacterized protein n=1 Tax=Cryptolaemus montrouzieri TaxID=559131 RepID=A0ABD2NP99_9CUCU